MRNTGLVLKDAQDLAPLIERSLVADLGIADQSMPDFGMYVADAVVPKDVRPMHNGDADWLRARLLATPLTPHLGKMAIIHSPFSPEELSDLQETIVHLSTGDRHKRKNTERGPLGAIPAHLPTPPGTLPPDSPYRNMGLGEIAADVFVRCADNQRTSTQVAVNGGRRRLGLHVDTWFYHTETAYGRTLLPNRLGLNLGPSDRYLVISEDNISDVVRGMPLSKRADGIRTPLVREFIKHRLQKGETPRALMIKIRPGEGYILPAESQIHDGSTWGHAGSNIALWFGHFAVQDFVLAA